MSLHSHRDQQGVPADSTTVLCHGPRDDKNSSAHTRRSQQYRHFRRLSKSAATSDVLGPCIVSKSYGLSGLLPTVTSLSWAVLIWTPVVSNESMELCEMFLVEPDVAPIVTSHNTPFWKFWPEIHADRILPVIPAPYLR